MGDIHFREAKKRNKPSFFDRYPRYCEIQSYIHALPASYENVRVEQIGKSIQGRPIDLVVIQDDHRRPKDAVMVEAGIHAREWLSHTTVLYFIHHVLEHPEMTDVMDYYIIPCLNPDGYEYTHIWKRMWRKNMSSNGSAFEEQWGVDLNRNFSYGYGINPGSSPDRTSMKHRGPHCFSEPEARCLARALYKYGKYMKLYLAVHSYGNLILYPWGFTEEPLNDERDLVACATAAVKAMKQYYRNSHFNIGCTSKRLYHSSGGTTDYVRGEHNIKFAYTIELMRGGKRRFDPPPTEILKVAQEILIGIRAMIAHVYHFYRKPLHHGTDDEEEAAEEAKGDKFT